MLVELFLRERQARCCRDSTVHFDNNYNTSFDSFTCKNNYENQIQIKYPDKCLGMLLFLIHSFSAVTLGRVILQ